MDEDSARRGRFPLPAGVALDGRLILDANKKVEMVAQQAVGEGIDQPTDVECVLIEEVAVVVRPAEDWLAVDATVVNVIDEAVLEWGWIGALVGFVLFWLAWRRVVSGGV